MKRILSLLMILCLLCGSTALAEEHRITNEDYDPNNKPTTELTISIAESYVVHIPPSLVIPFNADTAFLYVDVVELRLLSAGKTENTVRKLSVGVPSYNCDLVSENGDKIRYSIGNSDATDGSNKYLYFTEPQVKTFAINIDDEEWNAAPAGEYTDTIGFTIAIGDFSN